MHFKYITFLLGKSERNINPSAPLWAADVEKFDVSQFDVKNKNKTKKQVQYANQSYLKKTDVTLCDNDPSNHKEDHKHWSEVGIQKDVKKSLKHRLW